MTNSDLIVAYWLFGIVFWAATYRRQGKSFTLADLIFTVLISAWAWVPILACYLFLRSQDIVLFKGKEPPQ